MPAKVEPTPALPGLSPVGGKPVIARFDGGHLSSDGGLLVLREVEQRLDVAGRLAACLTDPRDPDRVVHGLDEIIRFRLLMIAAGYEDGNDADRLRTDPMFKLAMARLEGEPARHAGRQTPVVQAAETAMPGATRHDHRQTGELWGGQARGDALGRA